jgi:valyl-tRNA synthetase
VLASSGEARLRRSASDRAREQARLEKELASASAQLESAERRLADANFTRRAPADVVESAKTRTVELRDQVTSLRARLEDNS